MFDDATAILQFRYNNTFQNLRSFGLKYGTPAATLFTNDDFDGYSYGPLMTGLFPLTGDPDTGVVGTSWSGDDNPNQFFTTQDLFNSVPYPQNNPAFAAQSFSNHLYLASVGAPSLGGSSTYNSNTFYRMLSQIGVGSAPEPYPYPYVTKLNLNYVNVAAGGPGFPLTNYNSMDKRGTIFYQRRHPAVAVTA